MINPKKTVYSFDPEILLTRLYSRILSWLCIKYTCTRTFIKALFKIMKIKTAYIFRKVGSIK